MGEQHLMVERNGPIWLKICMVIPGRDPEVVMSWFTDARLLHRWWIGEADVDPTIGGVYVMGWPTTDWTMRGRVIRCQPMELIYSWSWEHECEQPARAVLIRTEADGADTRVSIVHGPYRTSATDVVSERTELETHRAGWMASLPNLMRVLTGTVNA